MNIRHGDKVNIFLIALNLSIVTYLHHTTQPGLHQLHDIARHLYFLPVTHAALVFGIQGGISTSLAAALLFAPYIIWQWDDFPQDIMNDLMVVLIFSAVAVITGWAIDRVRHARAELADSLHKLETQGADLRRAERLSALGTLAGGLAHEIRNPVGIIRAAAQLLEADLPTKNSNLAVIQEETTRVEELVQALLNYGHEYKLNQKVTQLSELFQAVQERIQPLSDTHQIQFVTEVGPEVPALFLDANLMEQTLVNLCINAIQAVGQEGHVSLQARVEKNSGARVHISVADDGPGIPEEQQSKIFDPFYTTKEEGTGLGLSVAQRIVDEHMGRIWVESGTEPGARFIIELSVIF